MYKQDTSGQYTQDFLKGQEAPTTSNKGYLQGSTPLAMKYNPKGAWRVIRAFYLAPIALIALGLLFQSQGFGQTLVFLGIFLLLLFIIFRLIKKVAQK
jgi:hypothetical protein